MNSNALPSLLKTLEGLHGDSPDHPVFLSHRGGVTLADMLSSPPVDLSSLKQGDVVALIGDFTPESLQTLLRLIDLEVIVMPLVKETRADHAYFFDAGGVDVVIEGSSVKRIRDVWNDHPLLAQLRKDKHAGLIAFTTGTTGRPKAILHDFTPFLERFKTPRAPLRTLNFLMFDHVGGLNTLFHTLFNKGTVIAPSARTVDGILSDIKAFQIELLPTSPTFLRMLLLSGEATPEALKTVKVISYGTERMDQSTLDALCDALPDIDFRQTFGMSELGVMRVKSEARNSLWMKVGGEGVELRIDDGVLKIRSKNRMLGYMNAPSPFDAEGWYDSGDVVEERDGLIKVVGRTKEIINVGGIKILPSEIERVTLLLDGVKHCKAEGENNPITGQHIKVTVQPQDGVTLEKKTLRHHYAAHLPETVRPHRIRFADVVINHRFKKA